MEKLTSLAQYSDAANLIAEKQAFCYSLYDAYIQGEIPLSESVPACSNVGTGWLVSRLDAFGAIYKQTMVGLKMYLDTRRL